jgi:hypothetical protein
MRSPYSHAQVASQEGGRQSATSRLWTGDLVGMARMQISGGESTRERKRTVSKSAAELIRVAVEAICKKEQGTRVRLFGGLLGKLSTGLPSTLSIAGHPACLCLQVTSQQHNND